MFERLISVLLLALAATGCADATEDDGAAEADSELNGAAALTPAAQAKWDAYVARVTADVSLQKDCVPRRFQPARGTAHRGVVVLFHGFTACPQQFVDVAPELNAAGFEVLLPLLPGHGRTPSFEGGKRIDDISDLPTVATRDRYADLARDMTEIASLSRGDRVVGGLSMGGMVATSALVQGQRFAGAERPVWTRGILYAPFFGPPGAGGFGARVGGIFAPGVEQSWGPECVAAYGPGKRAGICSFTLGNLQAGTSLGEELIPRASEISVPVQVVGVEADHAADNGETAKLVSGLRGPKSACFYAKGMPHAFVSKFDHTELDHAWLPALHRATVSFVARGNTFPTNGTSSEHGHGRCAPR